MTNVFDTHRRELAAEHPELRELTTDEIEVAAGGFSTLYQYRLAQQILADNDPQSQDKMGNFEIQGP